MTSGYRTPAIRDVIAALDEESGLTHDAWVELGLSLVAERDEVSRRGSDLMWLVGDWLVRGEDQVHRGLKRSRVRDMAVEVTGYSPHTLAMAVSLARKIPPSMRIEDLTWWHHLSVSRLPLEARQRWLRKAAEQGWSARSLRAELRKDAPPPARRDSSHSLIKAVTSLRSTDLPAAALNELRQWLDKCDDERHEQAV
jgi:hypothetical protein